MKVLGKIFFDHFWALFDQKITILTQKNTILVNFFHSAHRILLIFPFKSIFVFFYYKYLVKVLKKKKLFIFFTHFWPKNVHFDPKIVVLDNFSLSARRILLIFHIETIFKVFHSNYLGKVLTKNCTFFSQKLAILTQKCSFGPISHNILIGFC